MRTLILVGASVRAAAHSALRAGLLPYAIDAYADQDLAAACPTVKIDRYPHDFSAALTQAPRGPWMYTGGLENTPQIVGRLSIVRPLAGNAGPVLRRVRDLRLLAPAAAAAGCPMPEQTVSQSMVLKPRRGSGGLHVRWASPADIARPPRRFYLQEYIEGQAASAVFVAAGGKASLLGVTRQLLGKDLQLNRPFLYVGSIGPLPLPPAATAAIVRLGDELAARFSLVGLFNVDFIHRGGEIYTIEVNPRYSASIEILERGRLFPSIAWHLAACESAVLPPPQRPDQSTETFWGKAVVYADQHGVVRDALADLVASWNLANQPPLLADLPHLGDPIQKDQPVLTVFAGGRSIPEVEAVLRDRVQSVKCAVGC